MAVTLQASLLIRHGHPAVADAFAARTVSLPMFPEMEEGQQAQVIEAVRKALS